MLIQIRGNQNLIEKYWGGLGQRIGCGHSGHRTLKLAVSQGEINGKTDFFVCFYKFRKAKSYFNTFGVPKSILAVGF